MADITPVTREEMYLAKAGGQDVPVPSAVTREEYYLEKLSNDSVVVPSPVTRREKFLYFACGGEIDLPSEEKMTRLERLIVKAGGMDVSTPTAVTRLEKFWVNVEGGGWKTITGVLPLTFTAKGGTAVDWVIEGNDSVGENMMPLVTEANGWRTGYRDKTHGYYGAGQYIGEFLSPSVSVDDNTTFTIKAGGMNPEYASYESGSVYFFDDSNTYIGYADFNNYSGSAISVPLGATTFDLAIRTGYTGFPAVESSDFWVMLVKGSTAPDHYIPYQQGVGEQRVDGYYVPIKVTKHKSYPIQWELKGKAVRDQVTSTKGNEILTWDVIGIDHDECYYADGRRAAHSVTLQLHDCFASLQFDEREALFYAESAMPAGTYHFTVREQPWYASDVGKTFQFTLTQTLAAGSQICITNAYNAAMTSGKIKTFSDGSSTTAIETVDITEGSDGTDLGDVRNALVGQNTNSIQRALFGSNNWNNSAIRQWLNSSAAAGSVWMTKTKFDRPPSWASSTAGFLNGMDEDFVNAVGTVKKTTALNTVTDGGGTVESDEKFFLLSRSEVYGGDEATGGEGTAYSYYSDYSDLSGAGTGADTNRIKYRNGAAQYWWLRSPYAPYAYNVRRVYTAGGVGSNSAYTSIGVAPAICIPMDEVYNCNEVDIYIGDSPLTEGETVSKTSTGQDIELFNGENTVSTTLYNKPEMEIKYL